MSLPQASRRTYNNLRIAFEEEYCNATNNFVDLQIFRTKKQKTDEPVMTYINDMLAIANKLRLSTDNIISTIQGGLISELQPHVMIPSVNGLTSKTTRADS
jgi:hypothetical protein